MLSWGLLSGMMAFIPSIGALTSLGNVSTFYLLRILLGIAEAGFFPGIIFYLTLWFPEVYRGRVVGLFMAAIPLSTVVGAPVSGLLLSLHGGLGLSGWQWLFIIESLPSVVLSAVVFLYLTDAPSGALWLEPEERAWLVARLAQERRGREAVRRMKVGETLLDPKVLLLSLVYFGAVATNYGLSFFLPQIVKSFGLSIVTTGLVSATPYVVGVVSMVVWGHRSDRRLERRFHTAFPMFVASAAIAAAALTDDPLTKMIALCVAGFGIFGCLPVFWTLPTAFLSGAAAAAGIAVINSIGNLAGFAGPFAMGWIKDATGSYSIVLALGRDPVVAGEPDVTS
jgi:MFS transporter, ACS family, tartrate transporter